MNFIYFNDSLSHSQLFRLSSNQRNWTTLSTPQNEILTFLIFPLSQFFPLYEENLQENLEHHNLKLLLNLGYRYHVTLHRLLLTIGSDFLWSIEEYVLWCSEKALNAKQLLQILNVRKFRWNFTYQLQLDFLQVFVLVVEFEWILELVDLSRKFLPLSYYSTSEATMQVFVLRWP